MTKKIFKCSDGRSFEYNDMSKLPLEDIGKLLMDSMCKKPIREILIDDEYEFKWELIK